VRWWCRLSGLVPCVLVGGVGPTWGGLVMTKSTLAGKACANKAGDMVRASMGRRVSHPSIASSERRLGCRPWSLASLCAVAVWVSGSISAHVYEATSWLALRIASSLVAMPPHSSTMLMGLRGKVYLGMFASGAGEGVSSVEDRKVFAAFRGGVVREIYVGQTGKGRIGSPEREVCGDPPRAFEIGKNVSCSSDIWQVPRKAGARSRLMCSMHMNGSLASMLEMKKS
jgi:hypothetical protein